MAKTKRITQTPDVEQIEAELKRERYKRRYRRALRSTFYTLLVVAAIAVLVATLWLPVLQVYGSSMAPLLEDGEIVVLLKSGSFAQGDVVVFYYNNKILVKRVIAMSGDWVDIGDDGTVYVNGEALEEPYLEEKAFGGCDIELPYQVPEGRLFVLGDRRSVSADSRSAAVGCVTEEQIIGKLAFRVWPLNKIRRF